MSTRDVPPAGAAAEAPSLAEFEAIADAAYRGLPQEFRSLCADLVIQVDDYPAAEALKALRIRSRLDMLGLFQGVGLPFQSISAPAPMPNMIWLYRVPILHYWAEHDDSLEAIVQHVLVHEIGHHFGLSDADMEAIEDAAR